MRKIGFALLISVAFIAPALAQQATTPPNKVCLRGTSISGTTVVDDNTILFHMNDGKVWKNSLPQSCPNLKFQGSFSEEIRGGLICANEQMIKVLQTGNPCELGDFTLQSAPHS